MWCLRSPTHRRGTCFRIPSGSAAPRAPSRPLSAYSSSQRSSSPHRPQPGKKGDSRFRKKSFGPHQKRVSFRRWESCPSSEIDSCLANFWLAWRAWGVDSWVVEVLRVGYQNPFDRRLPLYERPLSLPAYSPQSIKGVALNQELQNILQKGAVKPAPPQSPGFYSRLFLVQKASGSWRPIIELSTLNDYVTSFHFHMETPQSVLRSIRPGDWMISLDLQVPVHRNSRRYLRFVVQGQTYQFRVLYFGLTTTPQVFARIMALVSPILHKYGVRMLRSLDDWLILVSSELACLQSRGQTPDSMYRTWHPGQPQEIVSSSHSTTSVSRHGDSVSAFLSSTLSSSGRQSASSGRGVPVYPVSPSVPLALASRPPVVPHAPRPRRNAPDEVAPDLPPGPVGFSGRSVSDLLVPSLSG